MAALTTNPLFTQAQQGIPSPVPADHASEFKSVLQPFVGQSFATGIPPSNAGIGPLAIVVLPDNTVLASGGPGRNELFHLKSDGGPVGAPLATLPFPIYELALDAQGNLWATTGGGPLLRLDPKTGAILGQYGEGLTQSLAIDPANGLIYVSSGNGIEIFNPTTGTFTHYSDIRVGDLAFAPDGSLWAVSWPYKAGDVIRFDLTARTPDPQLMLGESADVTAIAFGIPGSKLDDLLFLSHSAESSPGAGMQLTMVDLATMQQVALASGGTRGDMLTTTVDGRVLISNSNQIDVISPVQPPKVAYTNPPPQAVIALPRGTLTVTYDHDMTDDSATDPNSVTNPANYQLVGEKAGAVVINAVTYDQATRTAVLIFDSLVADTYQLQVSTAVQSTDRLGLVEPYSTTFQAVSDFTPLVDIHFSEGRADQAAGTVSYDVTVTNKTGYDLLAPMVLYFDGLRPAAAQLAHSTVDSTTGDWWIDLGSLLAGGRLKAGEATTQTIVTIQSPTSQRLGFSAGLLAAPYPNADPIFDSEPITTATAGEPYQYQAAAHDPNDSTLTYFLYKGPAGMTVDPTSGLLTWSPGVNSPATVPVTLQVYNLRGGSATQEFTVGVAGVNAAPVFDALAPQISGQEAQPLQISVNATDTDGDRLVYWADHLPAGASFDPVQHILNWTPAYGQAGTYPGVTFVVSDGVQQVTETTTLLIAPSDPPPTLLRPADQTVREGDPLRIQLKGASPVGNALTYASNQLPAGATLDPITGLFQWTPGYDQHGVYQVPFSVSDGQQTTTQTTQITVLNVNAPPVFDVLGPFAVDEGQPLSFRAFALDPNNPGFIPQDRTADGTLTPLDGTAPTITYTVSGLPEGASFDAVTAMFSWTPDYNAAGDYVVTFTATNDGDGTGVPAAASANVAIHVANVNLAPQVTAIVDQTMNKGTVLDIPVQAADADGDPLVLSVQGLPKFGTFTDNGTGTGDLHFAPVADARGSYDITVTATDNGRGNGPEAVLSGAQSFVLTVNSPNEPPHLTPVGDKVAVVGQPLTFTLTATDLDQDPLIFSATGLPADAKLTQGTVYGAATVTWTPTAEDVGTYPVTFKVTDNGNGNAALVASDQQTINLSARVSDQPPVLAPVGTLTATAGQPFSATLSATDPDNDKLTFSATNLPAGATLDPLTGVLSWTPKLLQAGTFPGVVFTASDGYLSASQTATIQVNAVNQAPVLLPLQPQGGQEGSPMQFTLGAADPDGDSPLTFSALSGMPAGATFDGSAGQFQ
jgi:hypothetical protein